MTHSEPGLPMGIFKEESLRAILSCRMRLKTNPNLADIKHGKPSITLRIIQEFH